MTLKQYDTWSEKHGGNMLLDLWHEGLLFDKDGSAGGKTDDGAGVEDGKAENKPPVDDKKAGDDVKPESKGEKHFTQAEVDAIIKDRLAREREKAEKEAEKARKKAEEDALEKNQEFQKLAEQRQARVAELEGGIKELEKYKEQAERYKQALDKQLKTVLEKLPKYITPLIEKMDTVEAMEYIAEHAKELGAKLEPYSETPEGKQKTLTDDEKREAKNSAQRIIQNNF